MKKIFACAVFIAAFGVSCAAAAADLPVKAPIYKAPPVIAPSWTGFYVGANVGGGWGNRDLDFAPNDPAATQLFLSPGGPLPVSFHTSGVLGGLQGGYNWQFNRNWLVGLETDFDWSGVKGSGSSSGPEQVAPPFFNTITKPTDERLKWFGTVRTRLGYLPTVNLLAYITGGFAYGRVERSGRLVNSGPLFARTTGGFSYRCNADATCFTGSSNDVAVGWTLGGGLEYALSKNFTLKAEYLYVSLGSKPVTETALATFTPGTTTASFSANFSRVTLNVARVGLNYRF